MIQQIKRKIRLRISEKKKTLYRLPIIKVE
jgi:hypothetical protein